MPYSVRCKACSSAFAIPDEIWDKRVRGRVATLKCRNCRAEIQVDGTKPGVVQISVPPPAATETVHAPESQPASGDIGPGPAATATPFPSPVAPAKVEAASRATSAGAAAETPTPIVPVQSAPQARIKVKPESQTVSEPRSPPSPLASVVSQKPAAKAADEIAAPDAGWSLMPPAADLAQAGLPPKNTPNIAVGTPRPATITAPVVKGPASSAKAEPVAIEVAPDSVKPNELDQDPATEADLWVVSYGEDDDRELTEKQIATELAKGAISLSTIVWQEGMPEWLPISGVKLLAKYAPAPKAPPARLIRPTATSKAVSQPTRTNVLSTTKADSQAARQALVARGRQPSDTQTESKTTQKDGANSVADAQVQSQHAAPTDPKTEGKSAAKGPPPLARAAGKSGDAKSGDVVTATSVVASAPHTEGQAAKTGTGKVPGTRGDSTGAKPPALSRQVPRSVGMPVPFSLEEDTHDGVFTSAPVVASVPERKAAQNDAPPPTAALPLPDGARAPDASRPHDSAPKSVPSQRPTSKTSFRPPKPVETATSTVLRTDNAAGPDLLITDEDFLAMQRRFPKWVPPTAIAGAAAVIAAIVYVASSGEELPPLPTAPVVDSSMTLRENPANQTQPKHRQPNLDAPPTGAASAAVAADEKDFAKLFAQNASKTNGTFDTRLAERAAMNFMELAARCRVAPDPAGQARVVVTFSTAGQVLSVLIGSPYANTATGKCIDKALRNIKTRAFQGEPGRLPLTVPVH